MQSLWSLQSGSMRSTSRWRSRRSGSWALPGEEKIDGMEENMYGTVCSVEGSQGGRAQGVSEGAGFSHGCSNPALFCGEARKIRLLVHGDDFVVEMNDKQYVWFEEVLEKYEYKWTGLFTQNAVRPWEVVFLNRVVEWDPATARASLEAD
eukprot:7291209-Heterocapsa_arctica.AAC.1